MPPACFVVVLLDLHVLRACACIGEEVQVNSMEVRIHGNLLLLRFLLCILHVSGL
jgi:hypothetical protein